MAKPANIKRGSSPARFHYQFWIHAEEFTMKCLIVIAALVAASSAATYGTSQYATHPSATSFVFAENISKLTWDLCSSSRAGGFRARGSLAPIRRVG